ncbi:MAG: hypothetical protein V7711_18570 [Pseudomonadales bacterium]
MKFVILLVGIFIVGVSATFLMFPAIADDMIKWVDDKRHLLYVAAVRFLFGCILIAGADVTEFPEVIWWLGVVFVIAAALLAVFPVANIHKIMQWWLGRSRLSIRISVSVGVALGWFIVWSVL